MVDAWRKNVTKIGDGIIDGQDGKPRMSNNGAPFFLLRFFSLLFSSFLSFLSLSLSLSLSLVRDALRAAVVVRISSDA